MGRRHYSAQPGASKVVEECLSGPSAPSVQEINPGKRHFSHQLGAEAAHTEHVTWTASRRTFPSRKVTTGGSTRDSWHILSKRHCQVPIAGETSRQEKRHYEPQPHDENTCEESLAAAGRRHLQAPTSQLVGTAPQVASASVPPSGRRRCAGRPPVGMRGTHLPQRRHLLPEDHLLGPTVQSYTEPPLCGSSRAHVFTPPPRAGVAESLAGVGPVPASRSAERRHLPERAGEPSLEAREAAMREYSRPLRRLLRPSESLVGGTIRREQSSSPSRSQRRCVVAPEDSLFGAEVAKYNGATSDSQSRVQMQKDRERSSGRSSRARSCSSGGVHSRKRHPQCGESSPRVIMRPSDGVCEV